jgi:hypothetical protein
MVPDEINDPSKLGNGKVLIVYGTDNDGPKHFRHSLVCPRGKRNFALHLCEWRK